MFTAIHRLLRLEFTPLSKQGDSRNVSRPLGRNPIRWSKVKLVFEALQTDGGKSLLTPVGDL